MATRSVARTPVSGRVHRFTWVGLLNGDDGAPISIPGAADMTVQVFGTFGTGGVIILQGSCEESPPSNYFQMRDQGDNLISFIVADGESVGPIAAFIRPRVTEGDANTDLTMILLARSTMR